MENLHLMPDEELVVQFKKGNNLAFDILTSRYEKEIYAYLRFVLHNRSEAEDVLQNTFLKAILNIRNNRYNENGKFKGWIQRIAHNAVIDFMRLDKGNQKVFADALEYDIFNNPVFSEQTTEDKLIYQQICRNVKKMIHYLPYNQQQIVVLRYYRGLSFKDISALTGVSINTALGRMRYAILNMRKMIRKHTMIVSV